MTIENICKFYLVETMQQSYLFDKQPLGLYKRLI